MISEKLHVKRGLKLALSMVHKYLEGKMCTVKLILVEPCTMNIYINKEKKADYVSAAITYASHGKTVI